MQQILTVDIGGTKTRLVWFGVNSSSILEIYTIPILRELQFPTPNNADEFMSLLLNAIRNSPPESENLTVISIASRGVIKNDMISTRLLSWINFPIVSRLQTEFPNAKILLGNDAKIGTLGAFPTDFRGRGLYLTLGTGIGGGLIIDDKLSDDLSHMEFGHMQFLHDGKWQKWQDFASGKAFFEKHQRNGEEIPFGDLVWREYAENLYVGLSALIPTIYPEKIIIGGGISEHFAKFGEILSDLIKENVWSPILPIEITGANESRYTVNRGALIYALQKLDLA